MRPADEPGLEGGDEEGDSDAQQDAGDGGAARGEAPGGDRAERAELEEEADGQVESEHGVTSPRRRARAHPTNGCLVVVLACPPRTCWADGPQPRSAARCRRADRADRRRPRPVPGARLTSARARRLPG